MGIVPLDFEKDSLSYQSKKKKAKQDDPDKLLDECFEDYSIEDQEAVNTAKRNTQSTKSQNKKENTTSYLSDILNSNRTR